MKQNIHPQYFPEAKVRCACGNVFYVGSTKKEFAVEICYACHPFYTGKEKLIDTAGRVEKFKARREKAAKKMTRSRTEKRASKAVKKTKKETRKSK